MISRLPLVGPYNTRPSTPGLLVTTSSVVGIGIVGLMIVGQVVVAANQKDRRFINCHVIGVPDDLRRQTQAYCVKRPGFDDAFIPAAGSIGNAIHVWVGTGANEVISAFGNTNSTLYNGTTSLGAITGLATGIEETKISNVPTLLIPSTDSTAWYYAQAGTLTKITDAQFPGNNGLTLAGTFAVLGGYAFIMTTNGRVYNSNLNSVTDWEEENYYSNNSYPDNGVGCIRHRNTVVSFGERSLEVLRNSGVPPPGSPLSRIDDLTQRIGAISSKAIININDIIFFAGATQEGKVSIYSYDGGKADPISIPAIEAQLLLAGPTNISFSAASWYGVSVLIVQAASLTYGFALGQSNPWFELSSSFPIWQKADGLSVGPTIINYTLSTTNTAGIVYVLNPTSAVYTDNGFAYTATIQTAAHDQETTNIKTYHGVSIVGDQELAVSTLSINWTDDDYVTFNSDTRTVDLSSHRRFTMRLGSSRKRAWKLTHSANTPMRLQALDIEFSKNAS